MRILIASILLTSAVGLPACGSQQNIERELTRLLDATEAEMVQFQYTEGVEGKKTEVTGRIEDSIRHSETLTLDGATVMERVVYDDVLAIHVLLPDQVPQIASPAPADSSVAQALRSGLWVIDPAGAPPEESQNEVAKTLGADPFQDATSVFQYTRRAIDQASGVFSFNPDSVGYLREDDPFPFPNERSGERRFDIAPPPLPRREEEKLPGPAPFRKMAVYVLHGRVTRILEEIDIESQADVKRAHETGRNEFFLQLARQVKQGRSSEQVRERAMFFEILSRGKFLPLEIPQGLTGNLRVLFGEKKAAALPEQSPAVPVPPAEPVP